MIPKNWKLPESLRDRLGREAGPQRTIHEEGHLLIILHELPQPGNPERRGVLFWRTPAGEWRSSHGEGLGPLRAHLETFEKRLDSLSAAETRASSARDYHSVLTELTPFQRVVRNAHQSLQHAREAVREDERLIDLRDRAATLERTGELLLQDANHGLNFTVARRTEEEAIAARRLNVLAAIFLPVAALTGLFGMNFRSGTGFEQHPQAFWFVGGGGLLVGFLLAMALGRRR